MEKSKILNSVLAAGLAVSLAGNAYLWSSQSQRNTGYIAAMEGLEKELAQNKEVQDTLRQDLERTKADLDQVKSQGNTAGAPLPDVELVYNEKTGIWEPVLIQGEGTGNPLEGMTEEEIDAWMRDTSDAPMPGDISKPSGIPGGNQNSNSGVTGDSGLFWRDKFDYPVEYKCEYRPQYDDGYLKDPWFLLLTAEQQEKKMREKDYLVSTGQFPAPTAESLKSREESLRKAYDAYKGDYQPRYPDTFLLLYRDYFQEKSAEEQEDFLRENDEALDKYETGEKKRPTINWQ